MFQQRIHRALEQRRNLGLERNVTIFERRHGANVGQSNAQNFINFSSNDYLGLAQEPELIKAWQFGLEKYGCGSGASPLVTGYSSAHINLEKQLCEWLGYSSAVLFNSGFSANQALLFSLLEKDDWLIQDKLNHASLIEAGMLSCAQMTRFSHNDLDDLSLKLKKVGRHQSTLVVTEGVFSMDGDRPDLKTMSNICQQSNAWLAIDDAHGIGVLGESGKGSCHYFGIKPQILIVTFGKAAGISGAAILCDQETSHYLTQFARHFVYSTAMPPAQAVALTHAISMMQTQSWRREKLTELYSEYDTALQHCQGYVETQTPIKPFICGDSQCAVKLSNALKNEGFWVGAIRPPTVPKNKARLRITLSASHSLSQVKSLTSAIVSQHDSIFSGY
ncbi:MULTISPECIES: 8-amino-7-oxononanoate synthase [Vibrio]|uniref:8-amino-7-oxononanoate synthase n=1 Tax=Vibrio casei TaxID=673372 RepID=A0A368LMD3_9VIBR|nr:MULTISPECIES: 8-amino-7-oxononanoate synthase [Vibrio]RCS72998.1 8-amino-7-oxononanoate synthase [Vibrio casei]SJN32915.1 8-amino-7-oxononanoate synthase [Vibrio casei]HBV75387.1 8-amino-7-oxononanoate synthase [Vibrio sp.]